MEHEDGIDPDNSLLATLNTTRLSFASSDGNSTVKMQDLLATHGKLSSRPKFILSNYA